MTKGYTRDRVAGLVLLAAAIAIAWQTQVLPLGTLARPGPAFAPLLTAVLLGLLGVWIAVRGEGPAFLSLGWGEARRAVLLLAALGASAWLLEPLGYRLTMFALVAALLALVERRRLIPALSVAAALSLGSFYLFADLLRVPLPRGPFGF